MRTTVLTSQEKLAAMKLGAYMKFAEAGIPVSQIDSFAKQAGIEISPGGAAKAVVLMSLLAGIPMGIAAHVVGRRITASRGKENELQKQVGYYTNASKQLERGLAGMNTAG